MNKTRSHEDPVAIQQYCFSDDAKALRVQIVGGDLLGPGHARHPLEKATQSQISDSFVIKETEIKVIEVEKVVIQTQIERVEVPVFHTEYKTIEVPVVTTEYKVVEVPTYIKGDSVEILKEVPKYIVQTNTEYKDLPKWLMIFLALNSLATLILTLKR